MEKSKLIDKRNEYGHYRRVYTSLIVDHPERGRLLLTQEWGGGDIEGQAYRWSHGLAVKLKANDTFDAIAVPGSYNDYNSIYEACTGGHDDSRPVIGNATDIYSAETLARLADEDIAA